jgi:hypothetical protein
MHRGLTLTALLLVFLGAGTTAAPAQQPSSYETSPQPSNGSFTPSEAVKAQQRAAAGFPTTTKKSSKKSSSKKTKRAAAPRKSGSYAPLATPTITGATGSAAPAHKPSRKHSRKSHKKTEGSTYNPPRTTTDIADSPTFVTRVLREVPSGVWAGLLALGVLAAALAANAIVSAVRARRMTRQRETLRADVGLLQSALLPAVPARIAGVNVSAAYRPAGGPAAGGDFYDLFPLAN